MAQRDKTHLIVSGRRVTFAYGPPPTDRTDQEPIAAPTDRQAHGASLRSSLEGAAETARVRRERSPIVVPDSIPGAYVVFESFAGIELALSSLDPVKGKLHPELRSSHIEMINGNPVEFATVFVPDGGMSHFLRLVNAYISSVTDPAVKQNHRNLLDRIQAVRLATLEALWTDSRQEFPRDSSTVWWEVWLRNRDGNEVARLRTFANASSGEIEVGRQSLGIGARTVVLVRATVGQLSLAMDVLDDIAELRRPHHPSEFLAGEGAATQNEFVLELAERVTAAEIGAPAVCVMDTGIFREHPLLSSSLAAGDCHSADPAWPTGADDRGHGTKMAGLGLYGDLGAAINSAENIRLRHRLESLKLLPPGGQSNRPELYGAITASGVAAVEAGSPSRSRVFSMAVTAITPPLGSDSPSVAIGAPTSWSASIDALAAGLGVVESSESGGGISILGPAEPNAHRLFVVSAGNVDVFDRDHLLRSDIETVQDPAQAWNVLTVGAYTNLDSLVHAPSDYDGWSPLAPRGELSPFSRTSVSFDGRKWPVKPEVVLEGGNLAQSPSGSEFHYLDALSILTTRSPHMYESAASSRLLDTANATSAATAQAAHLAASIMADYPSFWPETVRALIVHSAEWTPVMQRHLNSIPGKRGKRALLRRYGMGVPDLVRATRSANDVLTLIVQDTITPFERGVLNEIHFHDLPWPIDVLEGLGETEVCMRVTLSYFIEPNAARRGWNGRYHYASHGLRFDVRRPTESADDFQKRVNIKAVPEGQKRPRSADDTGEWTIGSEQRTSGSLHTDVWRGSAVDLAQRGALAVFPIGGWWKDATKKDAVGREARYALVVSIETQGVEADIWTPVAAQIQVPTTIVV